MKDILTTEEWIRAIKALLFLNKDPENIDIEQIKKIIEENTAEAYELPAVTETDNGKVLGVENGAWSVVNGGGDVGFECTETTEQLFSETVTTVQDGDDIAAQLTYSEPITADKLIVAFDGTQYICPKIIVAGVGNMVFYGGMSEEGDLDFTNFPFLIISRPNGNYIDTETANTYHIEVAAVGMEATNISPCFASAVNKVSDSSVKIKTATLSADDISVDGSEAVILSVPDDYIATVGVITIYPLETEDVYLSDFDCSGDRRRFLLTYTSKQSSPVTLGHVSCVFTYIPESGNK